MNKRIAFVPLIALLVAGCASAPTPASPPTLVPTRPPASAVAPVTMPTEMPSGAVVNILPTWTPQPTEIPAIVPTPNCANLSAEPRQFNFAPISPNLDVITYSGKDGLIGLDVNTGKSLQLLTATTPILLDHVVWSPNRKYFALIKAGQTGCLGSQLVIADAETGAARVAFSHENHIEILDWMPDSKTITILAGQEVKQINAAGIEPIKPLEMANSVWQLTWLDQNTALYLTDGHQGTEPNALMTRQLLSGKSRVLLGGFLSAMSLSPDKKRVAVSDTEFGQEMVKIIDLSSSITETIEVQAPNGIYSLQWSSDGHYILVHAFPSGVILIDTRNRNTPRQLDFYAFVPRGAWNRDGSRFAVLLGGDGSIDLPKIGIYEVRANKLATPAIEVWPPYNVVWRR